MKNEIYNEKELKALEDEIRGFGIPYSENEPDDRYFANFRVRLMEKIDAKEQKSGAFMALWSWLTSSPLRGLSLGAMLAGVIVAALFIRPGTENQVAQLQPVVSEQPTVIKTLPNMAPTKPEAIISAPKIVTTSKEVKTPSMAVTVKPTGTEDALNVASDFASMDESLAGAESDDPVNYDALSESELESVLSAIQSVN